MGARKVQKDRSYDIKSSIPIFPVLTLRGIHSNTLVAMRRDYSSKGMSPSHFCGTLKPHRLYSQKLRPPREWYDIPFFEHCGDGKAVWKRG